MRTGPTFGVSRANRKLFRVISPVLRICAGPDALGTGCPKTPLLPRSQVTDSVCPEFPVLDAHKELFFGKRQTQGAGQQPSASIKTNDLIQGRAGYLRLSVS